MDDPTPQAAHYFDAQPSVASERSSVPLTLPDLHLELLTDRGVFSGDRVDPGTKLLLLDGPRPAVGATHLLDLGCGYGPIAVALALRAPQATVWAIDVNERARDLCRANAEAQGVSGRVKVLAPDDVPADIAFDGIWSNPPIRVGKPALHEMLLRWLARLTSHGTANLVVQKHLGADSLAAWLVRSGFPAERLGSRMGYRILSVSAASPTDPPTDPNEASP